MSVSEYQRRVQLLDDQKCTACRGLGKCDDAEPGDISYNEWVCTTCGGSGLTHPAQCQHDWAEGYGVPAYCNHCGVARDTQPAQSAEVEKVREVIAELSRRGNAGFNTNDRARCNHWADKLTAALQEKGNG